MKKYNINKYYVKLVWTGDFEYKSDFIDHREELEEFEYDHLPTELEIVESFKRYQSTILTSSNWSNIAITGYTILSPIIKTNIVIK